MAVIRTGDGEDGGGVHVKRCLWRETTGEELDDAGAREVVEDA